MKNLQQYTDDVVETFNNYTKTGTIPWTYEIALLDLQYQIGSLTKRIMQMQNKRFNEGLTQEQIKLKIADELADIFTGTLFIARELDIDIDIAFSRMLESDKQKVKDRTV